MRVLQINKFLYGGAGAETVLFRTAELLAGQGHEVAYFAMADPRNRDSSQARFFPPGRYYGDDQTIGQRLKNAASAVYSFESRRALRKLIHAERPELAHVHNVYHQLTLSIFDELAGHGIPIVMTVHDLKPVCPSYSAFVNHEPCRRCITGRSWHVVAHRCIHRSLGGSLIAATEAALARKRSLYDLVDAFIVPSNYYIDLLVMGGLARDRMHLIPNFVADEQFTALRSSRDARRRSILFVGRLEEAKGIRVLVDAAKRCGRGIDIDIVGSGALEEEVSIAAATGVVNYLGAVPWDGIAALMDRAAALVVPSLSEENCPMVVLEAGARGLPVIASNRGGLMELVSHGEDGMLVEPNSAEDLAKAMLRLASDLPLSARLGRSRRARVMRDNRSDEYLARLLDVYRTAAGNAGADAARATASGPPEYRSR